MSIQELSEFIGSAFCGLSLCLGFSAGLRFWLSAIREGGL